MHFPLYEAASRNALAKVQQLIKDGSDVNSRLYHVYKTVFERLNDRFEYEIMEESIQLHKQALRQCYKNLYKLYILPFMPSYSTPYRHYNT
jgi:hypothetical protein